MSENEPRIAALQELGEQFHRLGEPPRPPAVITRRTALLALVLMLVLAGVATATILITQGAPLPAPPAVDLAAGGVPMASTVRLAGLDAPDPDPSQPPWDIRLSRTRDGETCTAVGQVLGGRFGIVGLDHVFRALGLGGVDACGVRVHGGPVLAGARVFVGTDSQQARTVVNGVAGAGTRSVTVYGPGQPRRLALGPQGSFITVYPGYVEEVRPRVVIVMDSGSTHTIAFAQSAAFEVPDPGGGSPWEASGEDDVGPGAYPDEDCAQASQELGPGDPSRVQSPLTPEVCGRLGSRPLFVLMRRFVPGSGAHTGFPWGNNPARTLVYGAASLRVASLTLTGAGAPRSLPIDPHGGVFLAVLDGHVDPRSLTLTARLRDGSAISYHHSVNLYESSFGTLCNGCRRPGNQPLSEPPVPPYSSPLPAGRAQPPAANIPIADTVRETLRARDPAGGPEWALRSWQGRPNPRANFGGSPPARFVCVQAGVVEGSRLLRPRPGSAPLPLTAGQEGSPGGCDAPGELTRLLLAAEPVSYVSNPYAYAPRPLRTVIAGMLAGDASHPVLLGAGAPRPLKLDANHAFLAVLPGRYWDAALRIAATVRGRTTQRSLLQSFPGLPAPNAPQARAPDPDGGAPWGFAVGGDNSTAYGRIIDGRIAALSQSTGTLADSPEGWSGGGSERPPRNPPPVRFDTQAGPEPAQAGERGGALSTAQVQRRTLPGRTIITAIAAADVASVTLATPRDVRTLRPSGPRHVLIAVYDGQFFRGRVTATVQLRSGRTFTEEVPGGSAQNGPPRRRPTLAEVLRSDEATLRGMRTQVAEAERAGPRRRAKILGGAPLSQIQLGLRSISAIVAGERARIAYLRAHPGVLPLE